MKKRKINKKKVVKPSYYDSFHCIASACEDNCCMGWHVDIDEKTYHKYKSIEDPSLKSLVKTSLRRNNEMIAPEIDYAKVKLTKAQNCAFLDDQRLCRVQKKYGEGYLSNVCGLFPRIVNRVNGHYELSLSPACPEAIRQYLFKKEGISFVDSEMSLSTNLLTYDVNEKDMQYKKTPVANLSKINCRCIEILKDRRYKFSERLYHLGLFVEGVQRSGGTNIPDQSRVFSNDSRGVATSFFSLHEKNVWAFSKIIYKTMAIEETVVSERYLTFYNLAQSFWLSGKTGQKRPCPSDELFSKKYDYVYENYFVNLAYRNIFPFTEADDIFDAYMLFVVRYVMIQRDLLGIAAQKPLTEDLVIAYFQSYSKAIEHHHYFYSTLVETLRNKQMNTLAYLKTLSIKR